MMLTGYEISDNAPADPQNDRKRRTPCREGRQGVEDSIGKYTHVYRRKSRINLLLLVLEIKEFIYRRIECLRDSQECCQ